MDLNGYLTVLRRRWRVLCLFLVLGTALAIVASITATRTYRAETEVFVSLRGSTAAGVPGAGSDQYQGNLFSQDRVKSYAKVVASPVVIQPVITALRLDTTPEELVKRITVTIPTGTVVIDIGVTDPSPTRARDIANGLGTQFAQAVERLETPTGAAASSRIGVSTLRPATLPTAPVTPRTGLNLLLGVLAGLLAGLGVTALREALDKTVKTPEDLQKQSRRPNLATVGYDAKARTEPLVPQTGHHPRSEAFRTLRTNLRFANVDQPPRTIVVTSSISAEGKSTTACNLALTLAGAGASVVLVDADLRRPSVEDYMGVEGANGLTDVLIGRVKVGDVLQPWGNTSLSVLPSGPLPPNPSELLGSSAMTSLLADLVRMADFVVLDVPPLLPVTDAAVTAAICDGTLLVARHHRTTRDQVTRSMAALDSVGATVLGTVLNMVPMRSGLSRYGYEDNGYRYVPRTDVPTLADEAEKAERLARASVG